MAFVGASSLFKEREILFLAFGLFLAANLKLAKLTQTQSRRAMTFVPRPYLPGFQHVSIHEKSKSAMQIVPRLIQTFF